MDLTHPIDEAIREKVREMKPNQPALAAAIGRSQGWVNKFMHGDGNATIDDLVRIAAAIIGVNAQPLTELERRLLKVLRGIPEPRREDALSVLETVAKGYRHEPHQGLDAPAAHTPPATVHKARGTRKVAKG